MLTHLHIRDFAIIDRLDLAFAGGMTVLTGETGAGKSILLDALGLVLGDRADSAMVRHGADRAEVHASFALDGLPEVAQWLEAHELDSEGECLVRRTVNADSGSRGYINGRPAPVQQLKELGERLVDIHGQHAHQYLLRQGAQRATVDRFGDLEALAGRVADAFRHWRGLQEELDVLSRAGNDREARLELLRYQLNELDALALRDEELAELEQEHQRLANVTRLQEGAERAAAALADNEQFAAASVLGRIGRELQELGAYDEALTPVAELADSAAIQAQEAASELRRYLDRLELDPERLAQVEQRLDTIQTLARKHHCRPEELPALFETLRDEHAALEAAETRYGDLESRIGEALSEYRRLAEQLSGERRKAAHRLARGVTANMQELGMKGGSFEVSMEPTGTPGISGTDRLTFLVTANPGQPPRPLQKVASGGELSRIGLAIQVIAAGREGIPTLIFDEVDVGVGGGVAEMVGRQLRTLGESRQVLCVTHQPQVAAQGHHHLRISKKSSKDETRTRIEPLTGEARVEEIARMSGGVSITDQTLSHAREMIALAQEGPQRKGAKAPKRKEIT